MPATPASSTSRRASSTPARSPGSRPGRSFTVTGRPLPSPAARAMRHRPVGVVEQGGAGAGLADLADRAAHVEVDHVGAGVGRDRGGLAHHGGVMAEELHRHRVLVRVDAQELAHGALVAVHEPEARDHLGDHEAGAVALRLEAHEPVADAGERREHHAVGEPEAAERPRVGERGHAGNGSSGGLGRTGAVREDPDLAVQRGPARAGAITQGAGRSTAKLPPSARARRLARISTASPCRSMNSTSERSSTTRRRRASCESIAWPICGAVAVSTSPCTRTTTTHPRSSSDTWKGLGGPGARWFQPTPGRAAGKVSCCCAPRSA